MHSACAIQAGRTITSVTAGTSGAPGAINQRISLSDERKVLVGRWIVTTKI
jgi:hypothetical protein